LHDKLVMFLAPELVKNEPLRISHKMAKITSNNLLVKDEDSRDDEIFFRIVETAGGHVIFMNNEMNDKGNFAKSSRQLTNFTQKQVNQSLVWFLATKGESFYFQFL